MNIVETKVRGYISDIQHPKQKRKLNINELEGRLREQIESYLDMDGYSLFYETIKQLEEEEILLPIQNKQKNGRTPSLALLYWINVKVEKVKWDRLEMLKRNDQFDFTYYENHPEWQTEDEWKRVEKLYDFLQTSEERPVVSIEERSLELFSHEKFLTDTKEFPEGAGFLKRIGVSTEQLKITYYGEPFVFWLKPGTEIKEIKRILIVENLSAFHTSVKLLEDDLLDYEPEIIIYGEGKKIENSFSFFFRMFPPKEYLIYYAGDIDAEGISILFRLTEKFSDCTIQPALKIYRKMLKYISFAVNHKKQQVKNNEHRDFFLSWFTEEEQEQLMALWNENKRIPQEVLTNETWRKWL